MQTRPSKKLELYLQILVHGVGFGRAELLDGGI
jgi:hypothetical protein